MPIGIFDIEFIIPNEQSMSDFEAIIEACNESIARTVVFPGPVKFQAFEIPTMRYLQHLEQLSAWENEGGAVG